MKRFHDAQAPVWSRVARELAAGRKASHWMWFVFPQIAGLGNSPMAVRYALGDIEEARRYLGDDILGSRLRDGVRLMLRHGDASARDILGTPDDLKFRSCLTLFREAAADPADRELFQAGLDRFYGGQADSRTLNLLGRS